MPQASTSGVPVRVGVALGAGSAAAMAELGALEALVEAGIPIHCVAGTSAGSIVGAALAAGQVPALKETLSALSRRRVMGLFDPVWPREGLLHGRRALDFIGPHLGDQIESLQLPFAAVATDLQSGEEVLVADGPVFDAVRASIAIPGIFTPWRIGGRLLVDGGLVNPVPVSAARALGAEFVVALNVLPLREEHRPATLLQTHLHAVHAADVDLAREPFDERVGLVEVVSQASRILASQVATQRLAEDPPGFLLQIPVPEVGMFDVHRTAELADVGRRCVEGSLHEIRIALERAVPLHRRIRDWSKRAAAMLPAS